MLAAPSRTWKIGAFCAVIRYAALADIGLQRQQEGQLRQVLEDAPIAARVQHAILPHKQVVAAVELLPGVSDVCRGRGSDLKPNHPFCSAVIDVQHRLRPFGIRPSRAGIH